MSVLQFLPVHFGGCLLTNFFNHSLILKFFSWPFSAFIYLITCNNGTYNLFVLNFLNLVNQIFYALCQVEILGFIVVVIIIIWHFYCAWCQSVVFLRL